jgi:hypothetical protein
VSRFVAPVSLNGQYQLAIEQRGTESSMAVLANGVEHEIRSVAHDPVAKSWELFTNDTSAACADDEIRVGIFAAGDGDMRVEVHCANLLVSRWHEEDAFGKIVWMDDLQPSLVS